MSEITYNLIRQKCDDYKSENPTAIIKELTLKNYQKQMVADFEVFYPNYPFKIPLMIYNQKEVNFLEPEMPFVVVKNELWGVRGFIQVNENTVNVHCAYCGTAEIPMIKPDAALDVV